MSQLQSDHPYVLYIFSNQEQNCWHFVNARYEAANPKRRLLRRITIAPGERLRTASERIALLDLELISNNNREPSALVIQQAHDEAFDVEAVTAQFFEDYRSVFTDLQEDLTHQTGDCTWAHDYALQLMNRLMFICFIQRKHWLGDNSEFLEWYWHTYRDSGQPKNTFFDKWLKVLFFEALNGRFDSGHHWFPADIARALSDAPYLNGGLFTENVLDRKHREATLSDFALEKVLRFLGHYNFTIAEDSPFDQEVAVDPEMIGKVYESLVNVSEEVDKRSEAGIFYTPRTEIDLMCRLSVVDYLANHLGAEHKDLLYEYVFALDTDEKEAADNELNERFLWSKVDGLLRNLTVLDPACGSGSFLVGMLSVLDDLLERADRRLGTQMSPFDRKKSIIGRNLYGVDVMEWACHVAELRLWLALIVDVDLSREELHRRHEPLLPHFSFKIRCGDSLVQELAGVNLGHSRDAGYIAPSLQRSISYLKMEKLKFYHNDSTCQLNSSDLLREEEHRLFCSILAARHKAVTERIGELRKLMERPVALPMQLDGTIEQEPSQTSLQSIERQEELDACKGELESIEQTIEALRTNKETPFVWDIAFVEIFEGESRGFDIVIGNPPYVRQENICNPRTPQDSVTVQDKRLYKSMLARSVYQAFPRYFGYRPGDRRVDRKIDAKSDLYVYFYFCGLSLLNPKGTLCFVTSNSWLDVAYGAGLQEFLLKHCHMKMVIDNEVKRSFASADINTVIVLFSAPDESREWASDKVARFVMFRVPFEQVILSVPSVAFEEIEAARVREVTPEFRVHPVMQRLLLHEGEANPPDLGDISSGSGAQRSSSRVSMVKAANRYQGNKLGGKYLRAPDIYWSILERASGKLVRLRDLAEVRFGIKTGANDFFYVQVIDTSRGIARIRCDDGSEHLLEDIYVRDPVLLKAREIQRPRVNASELRYRLVRLTKDSKTSPHAADYIGWGESKGFHRRPTTKSRSPWWTLRIPDYADIAFPMAHKRRPVLAFLDQTSICLDNRFYAVYLNRKEDALVIAASLSSTLSILSREVYGRANFGQGMLDMKVYEVASLEVLDPSQLKDDVKQALLAAYDSISQREILMLYDEVRMPDRGALDDAFLLAIGVVDADERKLLAAKIQDAACRMVWNRLAKSDTSREALMGYDEWLCTGKPFGRNAIYAEED
jgi:hypothetical protein